MSTEAKATEAFFYFYLFIIFFIGLHCFHHPFTYTTAVSDNSLLLLVSDFWLVT